MTTTLKTNNEKAHRRARRLMMKILREKARAKSHYVKADDALTKLLVSGIKINEPVELELPREDGSIEKTQFMLVDNFVGDRAGRNVAIPHFELRKVSKTRRAKQDVETVPEAIA